MRAVARLVTDAQGASPAAEPAETELVRRVQRGDTAAFDAVVRQYLPRAYAVAYRVMRHREDAQDLVQDAFLAALDHIAAFDATRPFGPWFLRIVVNRGLNARRARAVRRVEWLTEEVASDAGSPADEVERAEVRERFRRALVGLPTRQRLAIELFEVEGFASHEIAEMLGVPRATVRWYLHRARRSLRRTLGALAERRESDDDESRT